MDISSKVYSPVLAQPWFSRGSERPQWYVIKNDSKQYIPSLIRNFKDRILLSHAVKKIRTSEKFVLPKKRARPIFEFDKVILACRSDQAASILSEESQKVSLLKKIPIKKTLPLYTDRVCPSLRNVLLMQLGTTYYQGKRNL